MKKLLNICIALVFIGCTKSEFTEHTPSSDKISFWSGVATRVISGDNDTTWESGIVNFVRTKEKTDK